MCVGNTVVKAWDVGVVTAITRREQTLELLDNGPERLVAGTLQGHQEQPS